MSSSMPLKIALLANLFFSSGVLASPNSFLSAVSELSAYVYQGQNMMGREIYCGCSWLWTGGGNGMIDQRSCGYSNPDGNSDPVKISWSHIVSMSRFGKERKCWHDGGRSHCQVSDPVYNIVESDMHNITVSIADIRPIHSDYKLATITGGSYSFGNCETKTDPGRKLIEPQNSSKGMVARVSFYMSDRYGIKLSRRHEMQLMAWDRLFPVSAWEIERDKRIAARMGHNNPFVTGEKKWSSGFKPSLSGLKEVEHNAIRKHSPSDLLPIRGNYNNRIYHLPECPSYRTVNPSTAAVFSTEEEAINAGFTRARNCIKN